MTKRKDFKRLVRQLMHKTGCTYTEALRSFEKINVTPFTPASTNLKQKMLDHIKEKK